MHPKLFHQFFEMQNQINKGHAKKLWVRDENTKKEIINILE